MLSYQRYWTGPDAGIIREVAFYEAGSLINRLLGKGEKRQTVFSHIVQKRFSRVNEDVATDALSFILQNSESARNGMMKLLRGLVSDLPDLRFRTQQTEGSIRPDMCGFHQTEPRVFIENKFWAGLTDNQPVTYLRQLASYTQPSVLLMVVPEAREHVLWRELRRRLEDQAITMSKHDIAAVLCTQ